MYHLLYSNPAEVRHLPHYAIFIHATDVDVELVQVDYFFRAGRVG